MDEQQPGDMLLFKRREIGTPALDSEYWTGRTTCIPVGFLGHEDHPELLDDFEDSNTWYTATTAERSVLQDAPSIFWWVEWTY